MSLMSLARLAELVDAELLGDGTIAISDALPLADAVSGCITLVDSARNAPKFLNSKASAALVKEPIKGSDRPQLVVRDLHDAFHKIILVFRPDVRERQTGVHPTAFIHPSATIGAGSTIGAGVTIGPEVQIGQQCVIFPGVHILSGCRIGNDCLIYPSVVLYENTRVGNRVILHSGVVIGADGFGYKQSHGQHVKSSQLGWVCIEDDVEVGANSTIDRGTYGSTRIGQGTKIDNLVQIGHNCQIGTHNLICSQVGIAGSTSTGDHVVLAGQAGLADHIHIGDRVMVAAQSGVISQVPDGQIMFGSPAVGRKEKLQEVVLVSRLPEFQRTLKELKRQVAVLQDKMTNEHDQTVKAA